VARRGTFCQIVDDDAACGVHKFEAEISTQEAEEHLGPGIE
jgi:hypothetical protein